MKVNNYITLFIFYNEKREKKNENYLYAVKKKVYNNILINEWLSE